MTKDGLTVNFSLPVFCSCKNTRRGGAIHVLFDSQDAASSVLHCVIRGLKQFDNTDNNYVYISADRTIEERAVTKQ